MPLNLKKVTFSNEDVSILVHDLLSSTIFEHSCEQYLIAHGFLRRFLQILDRLFLMCN